MGTVEDWVERLRSAVRFQGNRPRTRAQSTSSRASRASMRSNTCSVRKEIGDQRGVVAEPVDEDAAVEFVDAVQGVAKVAQADLEGETGISETDALMEIKEALSVAARKELCDYPLNKVGQLLDGVLALFESGTELVEPQLPFVLLEDLFHRETASNFPKVWALLERRSEVLTSAKVMESSIYPKMVMMRLGNYLLARLSASHDTAFCGRVQMFLAAAMPLTDKSGVNLFGEYNEGNITVAESEAEYEQQQAKSSEENVDAAAVIGEQKAGEMAINYSLYFKFWQLQQYFAARPERGPKGCASSAANWTQFAQTADVVLSSFESKPFSEADLEREAAARRANKAGSGGVKSTTSGKPAARSAKRRKVTPNTNGTDTSDDGDAGFYPIKYLTSSRLLKLQLSDPSLRRSVLVQFAILFNSILQLINDGTTAQSKVPVLVIKHIRSGGAQGMDALGRRSTALLRATPPDGESFLSDLTQILQRDDQWHKWKFIDKCKSFERHAETENENKEEEPNKPNKLLLARDKMRASKDRAILNKVQQTRGLWRSFALGTWSDRLAEKVDLAPSFTEFIKPMEVAINPENGIEDEYHPRKDNIYCWRGFRLLSQRNLDVMADVKDGSLENATKKLVGFVDPIVEDKSEHEQQQEKSQANLVEDAKDESGIAEGNMETESH